jgi:hemin uptake protein HemP
MNETERPLSTISRPADDKPDSSPKIVSTHDLFHGDREICIEHDGEVYRLRITRRNKLILQK